MSDAKEVDCMENWQPVTVEELEAIVKQQLSDCSPHQRSAFALHRVAFYQVPIHRFGKLEQVLVVAHLPSGLLYFEDVEEGFQVGKLQQDSALHSQNCDQLELVHVLSRAGI